MWGVGSSMARTRSILAGSGADSTGTVCVRLTADAVHSLRRAGVFVPGNLVPLRISPGTRLLHAWHFEPKHPLANPRNDRKPPLAGNAEPGVRAKRRSGLP